MLPIHSRHYNRVQESRLQAKLFLAFSIDRYRRIFLDLSHICDTRSVANLSIYWSVGNHFLCRQKLWWVYLRPKVHGEQAICSTTLFFRDFCLIVQRFRTVLLYLSNYYHLKWLLFFLAFGAYVFSKHMLAPLHALASGPRWASDESFGGSWGLARMASVNLIGEWVKVHLRWLISRSTCFVGPNPSAHS